MGKLIVHENFIKVQNDDLLWDFITVVNVIYLNFSCTPDWHTEDRMTSYVLWILILGFLLPTLVIVLTSITTCITIREVSREIKI